MAAKTERNRILKSIFVGRTDKAIRNEAQYIDLKVSMKDFVEHIKQFGFPLRQNFKLVVYNSSRM